MKLPRVLVFLAVWVCWPCAPANAGPAPLRADELLLVYNAGNDRSRELAEYYAKVRGVPAGRLLGLQLKAAAEEISREEFERTIREPIRRRLEQDDLRDKVHCLVTFYGLPIRVGPMTLTPGQGQLLETWRAQIQAGLNDYQAAIGELDPAATRPAAQPKAPSAEPETEFRRLQQRYGQARMAFLARIKDHEGTAEGQARLKQLIAVMQKVEGPAGLVGQVSVKADAATAEARQFKALQETVKKDQQRIVEAFARGVEDPDRDKARELVRQTYGQAGWLTSLADDVLMLRPDETHAAVDSELTLVRWDRYPKYRWVVNTMNWRTRAEQSAQSSHPRTPPVLMVSRIDGPTPAIARGLIDKALAGEKAGPTGRVYIDARGISPDKEGFGPYDEYLRRLAGTIRTRTSLPVRLDNNEALFKPGECPQTVIYCGWYSLRKYIPSFAFEPGAVGFHIASFEAISIKNAGEGGWCKGLLLDGITATLGPVAEPYLQTFPRPDDFFGLLLTGRFTLAEAYAYSVPFHSWMMMLIGDPLYRPFANSPQLALDQAVPAQIIPAEYNIPAIATSAGE